MFGIAVNRKIGRLANVRKGNMDMHAKSRNPCKRAEKWRDVEKKPYEVITVILREWYSWDGNEEEGSVHPLDRSDSRNGSSQPASRRRDCLVREPEM